jgi:hypothetical protein
MKICVYCASSATVGLMGKLADAILAGGGKIKAIMSIRIQ